MALIVAGFGVLGFGQVVCMFLWTKGSGRPGRVRFLWWPLVVSIVLSIVLTVVLNRLI